MAKTIPTFIAYLMSQMGWNIFAAGYTNYQIAALSPLCASDIIKLGMYFLLLDINLYLKSFRRIHSFPQSVYEVIAASFLIDSALICVWFPVENYVLSLSQRMLRWYASFSRSGGPVESGVFQVLRLLFNPTSLVTFCYLLSILFLLCVLHATRAVDFRLIRAAGLPCFVEDATRRFNRGIQKALWFLTKTRLFKQQTKKGHRKKSRYC